MIPCNEVGACQSVLIIGAGLIGTSLGLALGQRGYSVYLEDSTPSHALVAAGLGAGEVGGCEDAEMVVVAVPPSLTGEVVAQSLAAYPQATVTDVASVKAPILAQLRALSCDLSRYVGSHPMAGSHRSGPLTARADLFVDRTWVVTAHADADPARVEQVCSLARDCQARVETMGPDEHDLAVAEISHVPQIVASLMAGNLTEVVPEHLRLAGQGVRDVIRIAGSDPSMWTQIITANHSAISNELARLSASLERVRTQLDSTEAVTQFMKLGVEGARSLPGKHGRRVADYVQITVEIPDSPGALARLFADVETAGVNVEDLVIEHDHAREVGYISISVEPNETESLAQVMTDAGWALKP